MNLHKQIIYSSEGFSGNIKFGLKIELTFPRELDKAETVDFEKEIDKFLMKIMQTSRLNDPRIQKDIEEEKTKLLSCFDSKIYVKTVPNEYVGEYATDPWYLVYTEKGPIKIGWRKSVIYIEWTDSDVTKIAIELFPDENVTKYDKVIHAWGYEKAEEYIAKILSS